MYVIEKDLDRTFPHHDMFVDPAGQGQRDLRSVLRAFVVYKPEIGYCQGMGMLVGTILMHVCEAWWCDFFIVALALTGSLGCFFKTLFPRLSNSATAVRRCRRRMLSGCLP